MEGSNLNLLHSTHSFLEIVLQNLVFIFFHAAKSNRRLLSIRVQVFFFFSYMNLSLYFLSIAVFFFEIIDYFSLFPNHVFIFKMDLGMSFHFQNVVLFRKVFSFSKCERFHEFFFFFFLRKTQL